MWFYFWVLVMLGLIVTTTVVAMREKRARNAAIKKMTPQISGSGSASPVASNDDGFGQQDPLAGFGDEAAAFDEGAFK